ncbi:MAG: hypothetical protein ACE5G2_13185 [Candidatus Krumholzibacteriia bacterium]
MRVAIAAAGVVAAFGAPVWGQQGASPIDEDAAYILFHEIVQVASPGRARDVSFVNTGLNIVMPAELVWIADPGSPGIIAVASRPIKDTAKAGEVLGSRGLQVIRGTAALHVGDNITCAVSESGRLTVVGGVFVDSLEVGGSIASAVDVDVSPSGLIYVLWGDRVTVYSNPPDEPLWSFMLEADVLPAVGLAVTAAADVVVAGRGEQAVAVYGLDAEGRYRRRRAQSAADLELETVSGVSLSPFMLLPVQGREGWVERDRFVFLADATSGALLAVERTTLQAVGRCDVRDELPGASPGRLDLSNRGQIAYVDVGSGEAYVLPTRVTVAMVESAEFRWRILDASRTNRIQGGSGDTLQAQEGSER